MKKTRREYIKIVLTITIITGLFMPYVYNVLPIAVIFEDFSDVEALFGLTIPILVVIPLLMLLIFQSFLKYSIARVLNVIFSILYITILVDYGYGFYSDFDSSFTVLSLGFLVSILLSLILLLSSLKYSITKLDALEHLLIATMALPIFLYFVYSLEDGIEDTNYGFYIINGSFIALYVMAVYTIFNTRHHKKEKV